MTAKPKPRQFLALKTKEVSLVDKAANLREFIVTKRDTTAAQPDLAIAILKASTPDYSFNAAMAIPEMRDKLWRATDALVCLVKNIVLGENGEASTLTAEEQQAAVKNVLKQFSQYIVNLVGEVITMPIQKSDGATKIITLMKAASGPEGLEADVLDLVSKIVATDKDDELAKLSDQLVEKAKRMTPARKAKLDELITGLQKFSTEFDAAQEAAKAAETVGNVDTSAADAAKAFKAKADEDKAKAEKAKTDADKSKTEGAAKDAAPVPPAFDPAALSASMEAAIAKAMAPVLDEVKTLKGQLTASNTANAAKDTALAQIKKRLDASESAPKTEGDTTDVATQKKANLWGGVI